LFLAKSAHGFLLAVLCGGKNWFFLYLFGK